MLVASMAAGVLGGCGNGEAADTSSVSGGTESAEAKRLMDLGEGDGRPPEERKVAEGR